MPRTEKANQQIREERREHILDAAVSVFAHKGLAATKITDIAAASETSAGLMYRYFENKEQIFAALVERAMQATSEIAQAALQQAGTPLERLRWFLHYSVPGLWAWPDYSLLIQHALTSEATPAEVRTIAVEQSDVIRRMVRQLVIEGQASGEVIAQDPDTLTMMVLACIQGLTIGAAHKLAFNYPDPDPELIIRIIKA